MNRTDNGVARTCKTIAIIVWICGLIVSIVLAIQLNDSLGTGGFMYFLILAIVSFIQGLMIYALGEIIHLLHYTRESNEQILTNSRQILDNKGLQVNTATWNNEKDRNNIYCAVCGAKKQQNRTSCFRCGAMYNDE